MEGSFSQDGFRYLMFYGVMVLSAVVAVAILYLLMGSLSGKRLLLWVLADSVLWCSGFFWAPPSIRWLYLAIPFVLPVSGPLLGCAGALAFRFSRQQNYLSDDPTLNAIFNPPGKMTRLTYVSLEEILLEDRKIVSAGDILKWGDVSLKQALIDRLSSEGSSPRAIRILKGAWNDPDEEVRLFATTVLTRLEKSYQESIHVLERMSREEVSCAQIGKAYFDYAMSGLVGLKLTQVLIRKGLSSYLNALKANESFSSEELLSIGSQAIAHEDIEVERLVMDRIRVSGREKEIKLLEWMRLYQDGRFSELKSDIRLSSVLLEDGIHPDYLDLWMSASEESG